jgi:hypothetical protein
MDLQNFGVCQLCGQGTLILVKDAGSGRLLVMCDDCESQWLSKEDSENHDKALKNEVRVVRATLADLSDSDWSD